MLSSVWVCTWNIQLGLRLEAVVDAVRSCAAFRDLDLLCLQEASVHGGRPDAAQIAEAMGSGSDHFQATAQMRRGMEQANALIWRQTTFRPSEPEIVSLGKPALAKMKRMERTLLRAIAPQERIAIRAESSALRVYVVHLDVIGFSHNLEQLRTVITDGKQVNFENQDGGHGAIGGEQLHPFVLAKDEWGIDTSGVHRAHELHPILSGRRDRLAES